MNKLNRKSCIAGKVAFVDGLPGCGKTLVSQLVAGMDRVELLSYLYELEHICSLHFLNELSFDTTVAMIRIQTDLKIYNTMMGRDVNFRASDLSSVYLNHDPGRYFQRLFGPGDEKIPEIIRREKPILNLATHNLLSYCLPVFEALGGRCCFIEVVRHPLYMIRQQVLNMKHLIDDVRCFAVHFEHGDKTLPYYIRGWEDEFIKSTPAERVVRMMERILLRNEEIKSKLNEKYNATILTVPFEQLVLDPDPWMLKIANLLETKISDTTRRVMHQQNVPRKKVAEGIDLDIYRRCGWVPPQETTTERDELDIRRQDIVGEMSAEVVELLDRLCNKYETEYWAPDNFKNTSMVQE